MKTALLLTFLLASSVVIATPHHQGTNGRLTRDAENGPASGTQDAESAAYVKESIEDELEWMGFMFSELDVGTD